MISTAPLPVPRVSTLALPSCCLRLRLILRSIFMMRLLAMLRDAQWSKDKRFAGGRRTYALLIFGMLSGLSVWADRRSPDGEAAEFRDPGSKASARRFSWRALRPRVRAASAGQGCYLRSLR